MRLPAVDDRQSVVTAFVLVLLIVSLMGMTYWGILGYLPYTRTRGPGVRNQPIVRGDVLVY